MEIIRGRLSAQDVVNSNVRYNPDGDEIEYTPDGGTTWTPAPSLDIRHSPLFLKPPVTGSTKRCDAAANMTKWLKDFIDGILFDFEIVGTVTTIINSILLSLSVVTEGFTTFLALISEAAETISTIGGTALAIAFTSTEYDLLNCIFYCHADVDGRISADALIAVEDDITAQLNTTAALIVNTILFIQGEIGLSNAGSIGAQTGDCDACACSTTLCVGFNDGDPYEFYANPEAPLVPTGYLNPDFGNPLPSGHSDDNFSYGNYQKWLGVKVDLGDVRTVTAAHFDFFWYSSNPSLFRGVYFLDSSLSILVQQTTTASSLTSTWLTFSYTGDPVENCRYVVAIIGQTSGSPITGELSLDNVCSVYLD